MNRFPLLIALFAILLGMLPACGGSGFEEPAHAPVDSRDDAASHRQDFLDAPDVDVPFYLYSRRCSREDILDAVERIRSDGGYVRLIHGGVALSASGPAELVERLFHREEFAIVMEGENAPPIDAAQECVSAIRTTLLAWANEAETREKADLPPTAVGSPLVNDAFEAPHDASTIWTTGPMLGDVGVFLFTPESDGTIDANAENWSQGMWDQIYAEVSAGIGFWPTHAAGYGKTVTFELFALPLSDPALQTGYEPITRPRSDQCLWIQEVLGNLGYNDANCFRNVSRFNADQMLLHEKDAFVSVFVVNSLNDTDGRFTDNWFAYAYFGGPFVVMTLDNDGWTIEGMDLTMRHELGHSFHTCDEYASPGYYICGCTCPSNPWYTDNSNCQNGCGGASPCVMISNTDVTCEHTRSQLGWNLDVVEQDMCSNAMHFTSLPASFSVHLPSPWKAARILRKK